jgi:hypothetical protein
MFNIFKKPNIAKETDLTKYIFDESKIPRWIAERYADLSEQGYSGKRELNRISTTQFSGSDKQILLDQRRILKPYQVNVDVLNVQNSVHGTILHNSILQIEPDRQEKSIGKFTISGQCDRIKDGVAYDLKNTSVYSGKDLFRELDLCPDYYDLSLEDLYELYPSIFKFLSQLSIYSWLYDLKSEVGYITFIFNNWSFKDKSTIPSRNMEIELRLASHSKVEEYLTKRLERIESYQESGYLPQCNDSATGAKSSSAYKIVKWGKSRAVANSGGRHNTLEQASIAQVEFPGTEIIEIKSSSEPLLCMQYCSFNTEVNGKSVCEQGQQIKQEHQ